MHFDFRDLEHFIAVAETGSIARAAERCHTVDGLTMTPFRNDELVVVLKPDHALAQRSALCFGDIAGAAQRLLDHLLAQA